MKGREMAEPLAITDIKNDKNPSCPSLDFALMVSRGLHEHPRRLDSRYLYDSFGSLIFEQICEQPEYYLTRTEAGILEAAAKEIAGITGPVKLVEFGSGSSVKTRLLLRAYCARYGSVSYSPVDISESILDLAKREITASFPAVEIEALNGTYEEAFPLLGSMSPSMLLFLGSTAGNLDTHEAAGFWGNISRHLNPGDFCLLGIDINEDPETLHDAYNDSAGFSEAFTRNLFERMNRELGTDLDIQSIRHVARYDERSRRVEIFAHFLEDQEIVIEALGPRYPHPGRRADSHRSQPQVQPQADGPLPQHLRA